MRNSVMKDLLKNFIKNFIVTRNNKTAIIQENIKLFLTVE